MAISIETIKKELESWINKVKMEDIRTILSDPEKLGRLFNNRHLKRFIDDLKMMLSLLKDYWTGEYRNIPWSTIAILVAALLYVLSPIDLIPDFIPIVGFMDDAMVMGLCLSMIGSTLEDYKIWKKDRDDNHKRPSD